MENKPSDDVVIFEIWQGCLSVERFTAGRSSLCKVSPTFKVMLKEAYYRPGEVIKVEDCDARGFQSLLSWIQGSSLDIRSIPTALSLMYLSSKYMIPDLVLPVLQYITEHVCWEHAVRVLDCLLLYYRPVVIPSAPPPDEFSDCVSDCDIFCSNIDHQLHQQIFEKCINRCLEVIDCSASEVIRCEDFEDASPDVLHLILSRSSLRVESEIEIVEGLLRWRKVQTRRLCASQAQYEDLSPTAPTQLCTSDSSSWNDTCFNSISDGTLDSTGSFDRQFSGEDGQLCAGQVGRCEENPLESVSYLVRYLCLSVSEFKEKVLHQGFLSQEEEQCLLLCLCREGSWLPPHLNQIRQLMSTPRNSKKVERSPLLRLKSIKNPLTIPKKCSSLSATKSPESFRHKKFTVIEKIFIGLSYIFD